MTSNRHANLEARITSAEREADMAFSHEYPLREQELLAQLAGLREDLADLDAKEAAAAADEAR